MDDLAADIRDANRIRDFCCTKAMQTKHAIFLLLFSVSCNTKDHFGRENQRMKELMSEPLEVNRYQTWLPPPPPPQPRMARVVETSLRDDSRLPDSIYRMNGTSSYGRGARSSTPPPSSYWRGSLENLYEPPSRHQYSPYEPYSHVYRAIRRRFFLFVQERSNLKRRESFQILT